ncbi:MAG: ABC transporter ATP-binding protein [Candidatus Kapabacteria bacterium]|jgi:ABC-type Fe3+/spermidine/putrescine transport system ATPase subunit|nr:ABC transporter ATP-binding protein [Candidatus Kapabacteria bacterium]
MFLHLHEISKSYPSQTSEAQHVLRSCSLSLEREATMSILGRSGCGKTTLLKIIAGLEQEDAGEIVLEGRRLNETPAEARHCVYLYQEPLLFPHLSVWENIAFGLRVRRLDSAELRERVSAMLHEIDLTAHAAKLPHELSGGQRQRVAFARAVVVRPTVLLLDEPFAALDSETRAAMQMLYKSLAAEHRITTLFVTHDLKEAMIMGDRVASMQSGVLRQYSSREEMLTAPELGLQREIDFWETFTLSKL